MERERSQRWQTGDAMNRREREFFKLLSQAKMDEHHSENGLQLVLREEKKQFLKFKIVLAHMNKVRAVILLPTTSL